MSIDVTDFVAFYETPLGGIVRDLVGRRLRLRWRDCRGLDVVGVGYAAPYLEPFLDRARRVVCAMPSKHGVVAWPAPGRNAATLVDDAMTPFADAGFERVFMAHALEFSDDPVATLEEAARILAPSGRIIVVVAARGGLWARSDATPFGSGQPFSRGQLRALLREASLSPLLWSEALRAPPLVMRAFAGSALALERAGAVIAWPFAGVHFIEATKFVARPVGARRVARRRLLVGRPALAPTSLPREG